MLENKILTYLLDRNNFILKIRGRWPFFKISENLTFLKWHTSQPATCKQVFFAFRNKFFICQHKFAFWIHCVRRNKQSSSCLWYSAFFHIFVFSWNSLRVGEKGSVGRAAKAGKTYNKSPGFFARSWDHYKVVVQRETEEGKGHKNQKST